MVHGVGVKQLLEGVGCKRQPDAGLGWGHHRHQVPHAGIVQIRQPQACFRQFRLAVGQGLVGFQHQHRRRVVGVVATHPPAALHKRRPRAQFSNQQARIQIDPGLHRLGGHHHAAKPPQPRFDGLPFCPAEAGMEQQRWQAAAGGIRQLQGQLLGTPHLVHHHQRERPLLVVSPHQLRAVGACRQGQRLGAAHLARSHRVGVVGIAQPMARGASRQDRGIEGGRTQHQLPWGRAAQLLMEFLQPNRGANGGALQLGFIHHHPHIGVERREMARPAPTRTAISPHQLPTHHLIEGAHNHRLGRQRFGVVVIDLAAPQHIHRHLQPQPAHHRPTLNRDLFGEGTQRQLIHQPPRCDLRPLLPVPQPTHQGGQGLTQTRGRLQAANLCRAPLLHPGQLERQWRKACCGFEVAGGGQLGRVSAGSCLQERGRTGGGCGGCQEAGG